jgi:hypothetical protein
MLLLAEFSDVGSQRSKKAKRAQKKVVCVCGVCSKTSEDLLTTSFLSCHP